MNLILSSLSVSSRGFYACVLDAFRVFVCSHLGKKCWFPANPWSLSCYIADLVSKGYAPSTVASHVSAIAFFHKLVGQDDPTSHFFIKRMLLGANKLHRTIDSRVPISVEILRKLVDSTSHVCSSLYESALYKCMFILMFHGFMRVGEVTHSVNNIAFSQVQVSKDYVTITFDRFKHHSGTPVIVSIPANRTRYCPVILTLKYLALRGTSQGSFFSFPGSVPIQTSKFNTVLSNSLAWSGFSHLNIKSHSFRIGAATWAASAGYTDSQIKIMGRWKSSAFRKYIRVKSFTISL